MTTARCRIAGYLTLLVFAAVVWLLSGWTINFLVWKVPVSWEIELADSAYAEIKEYIKPVDDPRLTAELRALTHETVAYQRAWSGKPSDKGSAPMAFEDFFEEDADAIAGAREEMFENDAVRILRRYGSRPPLEIKW